MSATLPATFEPGIHRGIPAPTYHKIDAASASRLRILDDQTPAHLRYELDNPTPPTWEMILGTLIHQRVLEPHLPLPQLAVVPDTYVVPADYKGGLRDPKPGDIEKWSWRRKFCQQWQETMEAGGLIVVERKDLDEIEAATESVMANSEARELIEGADTEVTMLWQTECGFPLKARLDIAPRGPTMGDLKTCPDASERGFQKHALDMGYHIQAAFYTDLWEFTGAGKVEEFKFIAYEKKYRLVNVHRCTPDLIEEGRRAYGAALWTYMKCVRSGKWPGYPDGSVEFDLPAWMRRRA